VENLDRRAQRLEQGRNRAHLQELDRLLDALERMNLTAGARMVPSVKGQLEVLGIRVSSRPDITALIEQVWDIQERYLTPDEGTTPVRRRENATG
jgi:hypothetical protein